VKIGRKEFAEVRFEMRCGVNVVVVFEIEEPVVMMI
jgi:hypothetical protein